MRTIALMVFAVFAMAAVNAQAGEAAGSATQAAAGNESPVVLCGTVDRSKEKPEVTGWYTVDTSKGEKCKPGEVQVRTTRQAQ